MGHNSLQIVHLLEILESRTFADNYGHFRKSGEGAGVGGEVRCPGLGMNCSFLEVFSVINHHVASVVFSGLVQVRLDVEMDNYDGRDVFYEVARAECQWDKFPSPGVC